MGSGSGLVLNRNGYARLSDLESPDLRTINRELENYQASFVARTRPIWQPSFPITGDTLYTWSRQWEYAYALANLSNVKGRIVDAGSGFTFFPFFLAERKNEVFCCDPDPSLGEVFRRAIALTGTKVDFRKAGIRALPYEDEFFDAVCCISVLEHVPAGGRDLREFWRVLRPAGRLIITCDISLMGDLEMRYEDFALLLAGLLELFEEVHPLDLSRPPDLLTTGYFRSNSPWRLPWGRRVSRVKKLIKLLIGRLDFFHLAVFGLTLAKRA